MANIVPAESSGFETAGSVGNWVTWFDATPTQTTTQALVGTGSMQVDTTAGIWGLQLNNWPGWSAGVVANHQYEITWSIRKGDIPSRNVNLHYEWRDEGGTVLLEGDITITTALTGAWVTSAATLVTSPTGATRLWLEIDSADSATGDVFHVDEIIVDDAPGGGTVQGAAFLSASGTLTAAATATARGAAALTADGSLAAAGRARSEASTALSAQSTMTTAARVRALGAAALSGTGTLTVATGAVRGAVSLAATATMNVAAKARALGSATLSGDAAMTTAGTARAQAAVALSTTSGLTVTGRARALGRAILSALSTLTASGNLPQAVPPHPEVLDLEAFPDVLTLTAVQDVHTITEGGIDAEQ